MAGMVSRFNAKALRRKDAKEDMNFGMRTEPEGRVVGPLTPALLPVKLSGARVTEFQFVAEMVVRKVTSGAWRFIIALAGLAIWKNKVDFGCGLVIGARGVGVVGAE